MIRARERSMRQTKTEQIEPDRNAAETSA